MTLYGFKASKCTLTITSVIAQHKHNNSSQQATAAAAGREVETTKTSSSLACERNSRIC